MLFSCLLLSHTSPLKQWLRITTAYLVHDFRGQYFRLCLVRWFLWLGLFVCLWSAARPVGDWLDEEGLSWDCSAQLHMVSHPPGSSPGLVLMAEAEQKHASFLGHLGTPSLMWHGVAWSWGVEKKSPGLDGRSSKVPLQRPRKQRGLKKWGRFSNLLTVLLSTSNSASFSFGFEFCLISLFNQQMRWEACIFGTCCTKNAGNTGMVFSSSCEGDVGLSLLKGTRAWSPLLSLGH